MATISITSNSTNVRINPLFAYPLSAALTALHKLWPAAAIRYSERLFLQARRHAHPTIEQEWLDKAQHGTLYTAGLPLAEWDGRAMRTYTWGEPLQGTVVVLHGWAGRATQFHSFVAALVGAGYRVCGIDAPGHGLSEGKLATVMHFAHALERLIASLGPVEAVIAHSMGGAAASYALSQGLPVKKAVLIASAADIKHFSHYFARQLRLPEALRHDLQQYMEQRYGVRWEDMAAPYTATLNPQAALLIHDRDDREVSLRASETIAAAWTGAQLHISSGLSHRRILRDPEIVEKVVAFIASAA